MPALDKVLYTARTHTTGGRNGASRSSDGRLDIQLSRPGSSGDGTNPEQLFAAGWSACFIGAMGHVAAERKIALRQALQSMPKWIWAPSMALFPSRHA